MERDVVTPVRRLPVTMESCKDTCLKKYNKIQNSLLSDNIYLFTVAPTQFLIPLLLY